MLLKSLLLCGILFLSQFLGHAQITSTFDTDADGWTIVQNGVTTPSHFSSGGNPGSYIAGTDFENGFAAPTWWHWLAPSKFYGNRSLSYGQNLRFSLQQNVPGADASQADVVISNGSTILYYFASPNPAQTPAWTNYIIPLTEAGWRTGNSTTAGIATKNQFKTVLASLSSLRIRGEFEGPGGTADVGGLDNVILESLSVGSAPVITSFLPASGSPGSAVTINGTNFGATPTQNIVYFGSTSATITSATATQLTVTVPAGALYGPILVINTTTGFMGQSRHPFNPTFEGGGRIIPSSLDPKIDILLNATAGNSLMGLAIADMDGDGKSDILTAESALNNISIYRNLGTSGDLTTATFAPRVSLINAGNGGGLRTLDFDGDGKLDIACGYSDGFTTYFATYRNASTPGNLSFEAVELWPGLVYSGPLASATDIDGDGRIDLIGQHGNGSVAADFWISQNISTKGNIEFAASVSYFGSSTLDAGAGVSVGDLDNDAKPDLVVIHNFGNQFQIIKNTSTPGTISFGTPFAIAQSINGSISIADFNLDGKNDLAWKQGFSNDDVRIRINTHTGGSLSATDFATEVILDSDLFNYGGIAINDVNGDGKPDIMASDATDIGIFENVYTGGAFDSKAFVKSYSYQGSGNSTYPNAPVACDLNGDHKPDLIVGITNTNPVRISIYENKNARAPEISITTVSPLKGAVGSIVTITGDHFSIVPAENIVHFGGVRAAVLSATKNTITVSVPAGATYAPVSVTRNELTARYHLPFTVLFSPGVATFSASSFGPAVDFTLTASFYDLDAADLNGDNKIDIIAEAAGLSGLRQTYSFRNTHTSGPITTSSLSVDDTTFTSARNPKLIDLNGDNKPDLATMDGISRNVSVGAEINFDPLVSLGTTANIGFADFNHDGRTDLTGAIGTNANVYENWTRPGLFVSGNYPSLSPSFNFAKPGTGGGTAVADFDNDGWADMVATNPTTDNITVWKNNSGYRISATTFVSVGNLLTLDSPGRVHTADLDGDGKVDLITYHGTSTTSKTISVFHNQSTAGTITFVRQDYNLVSSVPTEVVTTMGFGDLDGDGRPEMIMVSENANSFRVWKNNSSAGVINSTSFTASAAITLASPRAVAVADINFDNKADLVFTRGNFLTVMQNLAISSSISFSTHPSAATNCQGSNATFSVNATGDTNLLYQWQVFNGSAYINLANDATYTGVNTNTLLVSNVPPVLNGAVYRVVVRGDFSSPTISNTATLTVAALPTAPTVATTSSGCPGTALTLDVSGTTNGNYRWYDVATGGTAILGAVNNSFTTPLLSASTPYYVSIHNGTCESLRTTVNAIINTPPAKPVVISNIEMLGNTVSICNETLTLTAPAGAASYLWSSGETTQQITVTKPGQYSVQISNGNGCLSMASDIIEVIALKSCYSPPIIEPKSEEALVDGRVSINLLPLISDPDNDLDITTLRIVTQPVSGATASIENFNLIINYGNVKFSGPETVTIEICDLTGNCTQQVITIYVAGDIKIFNAISANGDDQNPLFRLEYITIFPDTRKNHVTIYNRWGDIVFDIRDYNNDTRAFRGENNNGSELPSGTYLYKIEFVGSRKTKTGYLTLKR